MIPFQPMGHSSLQLHDHCFPFWQGTSTAPAAACHMPGAGSTGTPAGGCAPNRWQQKRSCSATCAMPLMLRHHSIFQGLEDKGIPLPWERAPAASTEAVPSSSPGMKGGPECTQTESSSAYSDLAISDLGSCAPCSSCSTGFFATSSSPLTGHQGTQAYGSHSPDLYILPPVL